MQYKDYYAILGVSRSATDEEIKRAYRKLARKYHPDVSKETNAEEKFKELQEAYAVLKDTEKRRAYDNLGNDWKARQEFKPPPDWQTSHGNFHTGGFSSAGANQFSDFFETLFGGGGFTNRHTSRSGVSSRGSDIHSKLPITLEESYNSVTKTIQFTASEPNDRGFMSHISRALKIKIPKGVISGQKIRLAGQGSKGMNNAPNGDLYIEISIKPHRLFTLEGRDVFIKTPITPWEAMLGTKITVPTLAGKVDVTIPKETQTGKKFRLKGRGLGDKVSGDQYIILQVVLPIPKNDEQKTLYEKMAATMSFDPRHSWGEI